MKKRTLLAILLSLVMIASLVTPALAADDLGEPRVLGEETVVPVIDSEEISPLIIPYGRHRDGGVPCQQRLEGAGGRRADHAPSSGAR